MPIVLKSVSQNLPSAMANFIRHTFLAFLLIGATVIASPAVNTRNDAEPKARTAEKTMYRLSDDVVPSGYDLKIAPSWDPDSKFFGVVDIRTLVKRNTKEIVLHAEDLEIEKVEVKYSETKYPNEFRLEKDDQLLIITMNQVLVSSYTYTVSIWFSGKMRDDGNGFFKNSYEEDHEIKWLAATQFETHARSAFPCFDEPKFKTPFQISIARLPKQKSISNMPLAETRNGERSSSSYPPASGKLWDLYQTTPNIPTHLVAFAISEFQQLSQKNSFIKIWARKDVVNQGKYILEKSPAMLSEMESFTNVKYPLSKMDLIALPQLKHDSSENPGLNAFEEPYLLFDEELHPQSNLEAATRRVASEIAQYWFGAYVTPSWWDYMWLNKAFATYFETYLASMVEPKWNLQEKFVVQDMHVALNGDPYFTHPMTASVKSLPEIDNLYDLVSHYKGASILRMLEHIMSPDSLKNAIRIYLTKGKINNGVVTPELFYDALEEQVKKDSISLPTWTSITGIMRKWTEGVSYPLIKVARNPSTEKFVITQETYTSPATEKQPPHHRWIVPISYTTQSEKRFDNTKPDAWSFGENQLVIEKKVNVNQWILVNIQQTGYYRVNYEKQNWDLLIEQLMNFPQDIHELNRAQLIDDSFALAKDQKLSFDIPIRLAQYLKKEANIIPWWAALKHLYSLHDKYQHTSVRSKIKKYLLDILEIQYLRLGGFSEAQTEDHLLSSRRSDFLQFICKLGLADCEANAAHEFEMNINHLDNISPNLRAAAYCHGLRQAKDASHAWEKLWAFYRNTKDSYNKGVILSALGCTKDQGILQKYLSKLLDDLQVEISEQNQWRVVSSVNSFPTGITAAIQFVGENLKEEKKLNDFGVNVLKNIVNRISRQALSDDQISQFQKLEGEASRLHQDKYGSLISTIKLASAKVTKQKESINKAIADLSTALDAVRPAEPTDEPNTETPSAEDKPTTTEAPSSSNMLATVPSIFSYIVLVGFTVRYYLL